MIKAVPKFESFIGGMPFQTVLSALAQATKEISDALSNQMIPDDFHINNSLTPTERFDQFGHQVIELKINSCRSHELSYLISEEQPRKIKLKGSKGKFVLAIDPLDGSNNMEAGLTVGTIFSIWPETESPGILGPGKTQVLAGYCLYGPSTKLVVATPGRVTCFILKTEKNGNRCFYLEKDNIKCPEKGRIYSVNESKFPQWSLKQQKALIWFKEIDNLTGRPYSSRYSGTLVADFHHILMKGGIYTYPENSMMPNGKIRYAYEAAPLSFICEAAGGLASDGKMPALERIPKDIHEPSPIYMGSTQDVNTILKLLS